MTAAAAVCCVRLVTETFLSELQTFQEDFWIICFFYFFAVITDFYPVPLLVLARTPLKKRLLNLNGGYLGLMLPQGTLNWL